MVLSIEEVGTVEFAMIKVLHKKAITNAATITSTQLKISLRTGFIWLFFSVSLMKSVVSLSALKTVFRAVSQKRMP